MVPNPLQPDWTERSGEPFFLDDSMGGRLFMQILREEAKS